ncbi:hypothetical protein Sjap_026257 [Stephania japonica]|uniref:Uncharacterized protein n=1 Tax=Stephania japonica TaxID=461633 RepID=A0AAP0HIP9_9MAGN
MMFRSFNSHVFQIRNNYVVVLQNLQNPSLLRFISQISEPNHVPQSEATTAVDFLINSCGLSMEKANSVVKKINHPNFKTQNPNSVLDYLKSIGFSKTHIAKLISTYPALLFSSVERTLKPKLHLFKERGFSDALIADLMVFRPTVFFRGLKSQIIPSLECIKSFVQTDENVVRVVKRSFYMLTNSPGSRFQPNVCILRECNVPDSRIAHLIMSQPNILQLKAVALKEAIDKVKELGFQPEMRMFTVALHAVCSMSKSTWDRKVKLLKEWGWSDEQIVYGFKKAPLFMACSEKKMNLVLDYFLKTLKWDASVLSENPICLSYSLKMRVMPRVKVYKILMENKVPITEKELLNMFFMTEERFLKNVVVKYKDFLPDFYKSCKGDVEKGRLGTKISID